MREGARARRTSAFPANFASAGGRGRPGSRRLGGDRHLAVRAGEEVVCGSRALAVKGPLGFTLSETMLALSLSLVLLSAAMVMLIDAQQTAATVAAARRGHDNLQLAFALIERAVARTGNFGCAHPQRPLVKMLRGDWAQIPEYDVSRPIAGYNALPGGGLAPHSEATLPLSGANGDRNVRYAGHGIDLDKLAPQADLLVVRALGPWSPVVAPSAGSGSLVAKGAAGNLAVGDVALVADCELAALVKITAMQTTAGGVKLSWAAGPGRFDNADTAAGQGLDTILQGNGSLVGGFAADAIVARVETLFFFLAPSRVLNSQGVPVMALWLKFGPAAAVELIAGIDDLQIWLLAAVDDSPASPMGYFTPQHLPVNAHVVGVRVSMRSRSDQVLDKSVAAPRSFSRARTFMLPQFARQGWVL